METISNEIMIDLVTDYIANMITCGLRAPVAPP